MEAKDQKEMGTQMNSIDWHPGETAKGIVVANGDVHVFSEEEYPYHISYEEAHPELGKPQGYFYVDKNGGVEVTSPSIYWGDSDDINHIYYEIIKADSHFYKLAEDDELHFA